MYKQEDDTYSKEMNQNRIESIEDILRSRGFFDAGDREKKQEEVLVG